MIMSVIDCTYGTISYMDFPTDLAPIPPTSALVPTRQSPGFDSLKALVLNGVSSPHTRRSYDESLTQFFAWYAEQASGAGFTKPVVQRFGQHLKKKGLSASTVNVRLAPVRRLAPEAADNRMLAPPPAAGGGRVRAATQENGPRCVYRQRAARSGAPPGRRSRRQRNARARTGRRH